jgi:arylsulfatase A-like enzyme
MTRQSVPAARRAAALLPLALLLGSCSDSGSDRPVAREGMKNVLLVTLDTTRADYLGTYGHQRKTPVFDRLAQQGTRFDRAMSTASVTPVSHASILTGRYNHSHGLRVLSGPGGFQLPDEVPTLAEILRAEGYRTGAIHSAFPVSAFFKLDQGFDTYDEVMTELSIRDNGTTYWDVEKFQRRSDETTNKVLAYLDEVDEPFFLWVHYWDPHDEMKLPPGVEESKKGRKRVYAKEVRYVDDQFGRVIQKLENDGRMEETIIVITSDHGEGLGDHDWGGHRILYDEQIHVPLILYVPGAEQAQSVPDLVSTIDILPTVLDYLDLPTPPDVTGRSLRELMEGGSDPDRLIFADQINKLDDNAKMVTKRPTDDFLYCAMDRRWKLIYRPTNPHLSELYDLEVDPEEKVNLYRPRQPEAVRLLKELAVEGVWVTEPFEAVEVEGREGAAEALAALGYTGDEEGEDSMASSLDIDWDWVCPDASHMARSDARGECAECSTPLVPRVR